MSQHLDNVRPFICPQVRRHRHYTRVADVIPLYPMRRPFARWHAVVFCAVVLVALIATVAATALGLKGVANRTMGQMMPMAWW